MLNKNEIRKEVSERTIGYIVAALGLVAGLAWNDAVKALIEYAFPLSQNTLVAKFIYATVVTVVIVAISSSLVRLVSRGDKN